MAAQGEYLYRLGFLSLILFPISLLYGLLFNLQRGLYRTGILQRKRVTAPVIVVGNLTVGGTGKTQLVISIARHLAANGYRPGIIARGYKGTSPVWPREVEVDTNPEEVGDEPVLMATATGLPVCAGPDRHQSAQQLVDQHNCNIIISDDGLQHHRLHRDVEIVVIDGIRRFGNGLLLPAGPLRERTSRLQSVDFVVCRGGVAAAGEIGVEYSANAFVNLGNSDRVALDYFKGKSVHAIAGIGNPDQFFTMLEQAGLAPTRHVFPDHYAYRAEDFQFNDSLPVVMTQKDAVKCRQWADDRLWYLEISAKLPETLALGILQRLKELPRG